MIADGATAEYLPVNTFAVLHQLRAELEKLGTNSLVGIKSDTLDRLLWLLNAQYYGELATIDMVSKWQEIYGREVSDVVTK